MTGKVRVPTVGTVCSSTSEAAEPSVRARNFLGKQFLQEECCSDFSEKIVFINNLSIPPFDCSEPL